MDSRHEKLVAVLRDARKFLSRSDNDFSWSSWKDAPTALSEIDDLIARITSDDMPRRSDLEVLFLPTGPIQEVSLSSGWGPEFLDLSTRFDHAIAKSYDEDIFEHLGRLLPKSRRPE